MASLRAHVRADETLERHLHEEEGRRYLGGFGLVAFRRQLWRTWPDYSITTARPSGYEAIGSGEGIALGSLYSTAGLETETRLRLALEAASLHCRSVGPPFQFVTVPLT
ncbi:MAG: hypothetical protein LC798_17110 [Chloroflexi bacterium]|nr:hypothetical protein [Chloroflexota bacterium]